MTLEGTTLTRHVLIHVEAYLRLNTTVTCLDDFLDTFLPKCDSSSTLETLKSIGAYDALAGRWKSLPAQPQGSELPYNVRFANVANAIGQAACGQNEAPKRFWLDRHSSKPKVFTHAVANRPDIVNVLGNKEDWERLGQAIRVAEDNMPDDDPDIVDRPLKKIQASWVRTIVPVDIMPNTVVNLEEAQKAITRLCGFMRQMLREQYDRQYVYGVILFQPSLSLWYCDRSGLVGADSTIDIHDEPEKFMTRVIAHFSIADPFQLGWDRTMQLYRGPSEKVVYSHSPEVITVHDADAKPHLLVTIRALSVARSEIMCGRGTIVWLAMDLMNKEAVVLKQSWRPLTSTSENDFYEIAGPSGHICRVYLNYEVPGARTLSELRKRVKSYSYHQSSTIQAGETVKRKAIPDEVLHVNVISGLRDFSDFRFSAHKVVKCVLKRLVLKDYGWPLKYFLTMKEFLTTVHGALLGYGHLWDKGIAHRDISPGNTLICPTKDEKTGLLNLFDTGGRISDLDHSKHDTDYRDPAPLQDNSRVDLLLLKAIEVFGYRPMSDGLLHLFASIPGSMNDSPMFLFYYTSLLESVSIEIKDNAQIPVTQGRSYLHNARGHSNSRNSQGASPCQKCLKEKYLVIQVNDVQAIKSLQPGQKLRT